MKKNIKVIIGISIGILIGTSTIVGAATVFNSKDITYSNSATTKKNVKDSLDELYNLTTNYKFYKPLANQVEIGDYISMTPTITSYTIPKSLTGYTSDQTLNPSELKMWIVIKKNEDGSVDAVSQSISSASISFTGRTGYKNIIGVLNRIAAQYTNDKYVQKTRNFGYDNQTEFCLNIVCNSTDLSYWKDRQYALDANVFKGWTLNAGGGTYWVSNRGSSGDTSDIKFVYYADNSSWGVSASHICAGETGTENTFANHVRPILTLKSTNVIKTGDGKSEKTAYTFE